MKTSNDVLDNLCSFRKLPEQANIIPETLDVLVTHVLAELIKARVLSYDTQAGETFEYVTFIVASALVGGLDRIDSTELKCFLDRSKGGAK